MARVCNGSTLPRADRSKVYLLRSFGNSGHEMWDVTTPEKPVKITTIVSGLRNTHKNDWECDTGIAYLVSGDPAWRTRRMTKIYDLSNPAAPVFIRDYGVAGQQPGSTGTPVPTELHGPISLGPKANRVILRARHGPRGLVQIVDRDKLLNGPKEPTEANLRYPRSSRRSICRPSRHTHGAAAARHDDRRSSRNRSRPPTRPKPGANARAWRHRFRASPPQAASRLPGGRQRDDQRGVPRAAADRADVRRHVREDSRSARPRGRCRKRAATSASEAVASARTRRRRTPRRSTTGACCS